MSMSMKMFGNELGYGRWAGRSELLDSFRQLNPIFKMQKMMQGEEGQFSYATQFIDATQVLPTSAGLPLNLVARGHAVADVRGSLRADLKAILSRGLGEIGWKLHPSADVNFDGSMTVDAVAVSGKRSFVMMILAFGKY